IDRLRLIDEAMNKSEQIVSEGELELQDEKAAAISSVREEDISAMADSIAAKVLAPPKAELGDAE
ncbi:MAG: hypothetical protein JW941_12090, partial [Candidatus Coatesbacteria bacterium]|nr:hypothetical protein [Candidatus Coatesbacteria bacterium]